MILAFMYRFTSQVIILWLTKGRQTIKTSGQANFFNLLQVLLQLFILFSFVIITKVKVNETYDPS